MSVSPVGYHGLIQRTTDVSSIKHNEDARPGMEQHNIQTQQAKQEHELTHKVAQAKQKENERKRYDAKEKGSQSYQGKKQQKKKDGSQAEDKVVVKGQSKGFDIKI